ncbi:hypothetical protein ACFL1R_06700 [Candidatus Latescibacterota bacterium]
MKFFAFTMFLWVISAGISNADNHPPSDAELLTTVLSKAVQNLHATHNPFPGKTVIVSYSSGLRPSNRARETIESVLTDLGLAITNDVDKADISLIISITDAWILFLTHNKSYTRTVSMTVHIKCLDTLNRVISAIKHEDTISDDISANYLKETDDAKRFCKSVKRRKIERKSGRLRLFSFILLTGTLVYFSLH